MVKNSLYLLIGKEDFLKREFVQNLRASSFPKDPNASINCQEFHLEEEPLSAALDFIQTAPFLSEKRLAVLWEIDGLDADEKDGLLAKSERFLSSSVVALISNEGSIKKSRFLSELAQKAALVPCHPPFERDLPGWIQTRAKKTGKNIERDALPLLAERTGRDLSALASAIEQLSVFVSPRNSIATKDVEALLGRSVQADVFRLTDLLLAKDAKAALRMIEALLREGTRAYEIVGALAGQLDRLRRAAFLLREGRTPADVGLELRVHSFFLEKFLHQAKALSERELASILGRLLSCDEAIKKSFLSDALALERLVLEICLEKEPALL